MLVECVVVEFDCHSELVVVGVKRLLAIYLQYVKYLFRNLYERLLAY